MKFFCDNCQAQYMISDEKVGPAGVRVRCKKCGHVIFVKRLDAEPPPPEDATVVMSADKMAALSGSLAPPPPTPGSQPAVSGETIEAPTLGKPLSGLEEEIGQALDSMFSDGETGRAASIPPSPGSRAPIVIGSPRSQAPIVPDLSAPQGTNPGLSSAMDDSRAETRIFSTSDMEKIAAEMSVPSPGTDPAAQPAASSAEPGGTEWFIAVRDEQVGPLGIDQIKEKFESGEVAGDTLVWSSGLSDWRPLSTVEELAEHILPKRDIVRQSRGPTPPSEPPKEAPRKDAVAFKPSAASALASLASMAKEEMAASEKSKPAVPAAASAPQVGAQPEGRPAAEARPSDLFAGLPSPSPDLPTNTQPLAPVPAYTNGHAQPRISQTSSDFRESPLARSRPRTSSGSNWKVLAGLIGGGVTLLLILGYVVIYFSVIKPNQENNVRMERERQEAATKAQQAADAAQAAAQAAAAAQAKLDAQKAAPTPTPTPTPAPTPVPTPANAKVAEASHEHRGPGKAKHNEKSEPASGTPTPAPAAAPEKPAGKSDDFLGGTDVDKEFANELDGKGGGDAKASRHGPYIPPPPGQADLPQALSQSDVVGAVTQHRDAFAKCVQDQKRRDPSSSGTVVMRWKIKPDGRTTDIAARGDDPDSPLATCFKTQIKGLHFGQYRGAQMSPIEFPFSY